MTPDVAKGADCARASISRRGDSRRPVWLIALAAQRCADEAWDGPSNVGCPVGLVGTRGRTVNPSRHQAADCCRICSGSNATVSHSVSERSDRP